jgi:hypothetical protein
MDQHLETLDTYSQRPDCFRNTVSAIRNRCGETDLSESERVGGKMNSPSPDTMMCSQGTLLVAAISMTLCELATAKHHSPPLECFPFSSPLREGGEQINEETQSICVGFVALHGIECSRTYSTDG